MNDGIIVIIVVIVISIILIAALIGWGTTTENVGGKAPVSAVEQLGSILNPCPCGTNLTCDTNSFVCKLAQNQICGSYAECAAGFFCSGICTTGTTGTLNAFCPCTEEYVCVTTNTPILGARQCKGNTAPCTQNEDCVSLQCTGGFCVPGYPLSYPCANSAQCGSGNCSYGFCQPLGVTTYSKGSACAGDCVSFAGSNCGTTDTYPLTCECLNGAGQPGTCVVGDAGLAAPCSKSTLCAGFFGCYNNDPTPGVGQTACASGQNCICKFTYENPNTITEDGCIEGMSQSQIENVCYNALGFGCDTSSSQDLCIAGSSCNGNPLVARYEFNLNPASFNFIGSTEVDLGAYNIPITQFVGYPAPLMPYKMFPGLIGSSFYIVDTNYGLLYRSNDNVWSQVIQGTSSRGTLIDAALRRFQNPVALAVFNSSGFSVVYQDTTGTFTSLIPFNATSGVGPSGTQYTSMGPLAATYIDISNTTSTTFDVLMVAPNSTVYSKGPTATQFTIAKIVGGPKDGTDMTGTFGAVRFYYDSAGSTLTNIAFVSSWSSSSTKMLQFSGSAAGAAASVGYALPIDPYGQLYYEVYNFALYPNTGGFGTTPFLMLTTAYQSSDDAMLFNVVALMYQGVVTFVPYQIGNSFIAGFNATEYLITSKASCVQT